MTTETEVGVGTDSRVGRYVRGTCPVCGAEDELVYETDSETGLVCATDYRGWSARHKDRLKQTCDDCGSTANVFRDPITRKNEYLCLKCHTARGKVFTNRWSTVVWESKPLGIHQKAKCGCGWLSGLRSAGVAVTPADTPLVTSHNPYRQDDR